jgi:hypothetical protein
MYIQDDELQSMGIMEAKRKFTVKGDEIADKVAQGYVDKGMDPEKAKSIGYATVTKNNPKERIG